MGIRNMFDHKYPITNLHEVDLTFMHEDIDKMIELLASWEDTINRLLEALTTINSLDARIKYLENLCQGLNKAYTDLEALKLDSVNKQEQINNIKTTLDEVINLWNEMFIAYTNATDALIRAERSKRIEGDFDLDAKIETLKYQMFDAISDIYDYLEHIVPNKVYNPGLGYKVDLNTNTRATYIHLRDKGITIGQLLERHVLVSDIEEKFKCVDLACKGKDIFDYTNYLYSPVNGKHQILHQIYSDIIGRLYDSSTINDVILSNLSIQDVIDLGLTYKGVLTYSFF